MEISVNVPDMGTRSAIDLLKAPGTGQAIAPDLSVGFILAPRFTMIAFAGLIDCLRHAADVADRSRQIHCRWTIAAPSPDLIESSCGVSVAPWRGLPNPEMDEFDYVVIVGGLLPGCLDLPEATYDYLRHVAARGTTVAGLCTGSFILAKAGLLDGRDCAVHIEHRQELAQMFPQTRPVTDQPFVRDGGIVTCPGGTAAIDLAYAMIEERCGRAKAIKSLSSVLLEKQHTLERLRHRPYRHLTACGDWRIERSIDLMERHATQPFSIAHLANRIGSSVRELNRAFRLHAAHSPADVWRNIRLENAHWMLLNSNRSITQIAYDYGFSDTAHFSRWFRRKFGEAPMAYRRHRSWSGNASQQRKKSSQTNE
jgi:transcriptional regulator GlxA family with amidase domain